MNALPLALFTRRLPHMLGQLQTLVEIESPSTEKSAVDQLGQHLLPQLQALGGAVEIAPQTPAGDQLICRWGAGPDGLLLLYHLDTVYPLGTLARQPFRIEGERVSGPGVIDMKGSIVQLLTILELFREQKVWPARPLTALFTTDEETGSLASRDRIEREGRRAAAAFCLEPALANGAIKTARKGTGDITLRVQGAAAHAGIDHEKGRNAIVELAHHLLSAAKLTDYTQGTTVNVGVISGGTRANVVPAEASAEIDFRITQLAELEHLKEWAQAVKPVISGTAVSAELTLNRPPMPRDETMAQTFEKARRIIQDALGTEISEGSTGGGSDANFIAPLGIPVLDGLGPVGDGAHSAREFAWINSLPERAARLAALLLNW